MSNLSNKIKNYVDTNVKHALSTMTNLSYIFIGIVVWDISIVISLLLFMLGVASTGYHWNQARRGSWHKFDIVAIYYVFATIAMWLWFGTYGIIIGLILGGVCHWSFDGVDGLVSENLIIGLGVLCLIPFWILNTPWDVANVLFWFGLARVMSVIADHHKFNGRGKVYDTFHGLWHVFSAIGIFYLIKTSLPVGVFLV